MDPLGLNEARDMRRYEIMKKKHGHAPMLCFHHAIAHKVGVVMPGYLSTQHRRTARCGHPCLPRLARGRPNGDAGQHNGCHLAARISRAQPRAPAARFSSSSAQQQRPAAAAAQKGEG